MGLSASNSCSLDYLLYPFCLHSNRSRLKSRSYSPSLMIIGGPSVSRRLTVKWRSCSVCRPNSSCTRTLKTCAPGVRLTIGMIDKHPHCPPSVHMQLGIVVPSSVYCSTVIRERSTNFTDKIARSWTEESKAFSEVLNFGSKSNDGGSASTRIDLVSEAESVAPMLCTC